MASAIQRLFVLFALIAAGFAYVTQADAGVAPRHSAQVGIAIAVPADADKVAATRTGNKIPCSRNAERSRPCLVCSKSIILQSATRTRTKGPGLKPKTVTGVPAYQQFAVVAEQNSGSLNLSRLTFQQTDLAFGEVLTRTGRLRI